MRLHRRTRHHHALTPITLLLRCGEEERVEELAGAGKTLVAAATAQIKALEAHT
jgi:hypothetical protein